MSPRKVENISNTSVIAPNNIARGIVHVTAILAKGAKSETCPNWNIIIGRAKLRAARVSTRASRTAKILGI